MSSPGEIYIESALFRFRSVKDLGDKAFEQLAAEDLTWSPGPESNSIAVIVQHLHGNMMSRWTDFLSSDGEKPWRDREGEFVEPGKVSRDILMAGWEEGWNCLFRAIESLTPGDLLREVVIRGQTMSALDAINRQLAHVPYHIGQIIFLARMRKGSDWRTLSISRGASDRYHPAKRE